MVLSNFTSIVKSSFYLADISHLNKYQLSVILNVHNTHKRQRSSDKFRLHKYHVYHKTTRWTCYFVVFGIFTFVKKTNFPSSTKLQNFMIRKPFFECSPKFGKKPVLMSIIYSGNIKYFIFLISGKSATLNTHWKMCMVE